MTLLIILTLIAPIPAGVLVYGLLGRLLSRWDRRAEIPAFVRRPVASTAAEIDAVLAEGEPARRAA